MDKATLVSEVSKYFEYQCAATGTTVSPVNCIGNGRCDSRRRKCNIATIGGNSASLSMVVTAPMQPTTVQRSVTAMMGTDDYRRVTGYCVPPPHIHD